MRTVTILLGLLLITNTTWSQDTSHYAVVEQLIRIDKLDQL